MAHDTAMLDSTYDACKAILKTDPSIAPSERNELLRLLRNGPIPPTRVRESTAPPIVEGPRLLRRCETAHRLGVSLRTVDKLAQAGALKRCVLPGRKRGAGFSLEEVESLIK
jgi:hypothetical protein